MHTKAVEHFSGGPKPNGPTLLLDRQRRKEDWDQAILAERDSKLGMPSDLKQELAVSPLVEQLLSRQSPDRQPAQHEGSRAETKILTLLFASDTDEFDPARLLELLSRDDEFRLLLA